MRWKYLDVIVVVVVDDHVDALVVVVVVVVVDDDALAAAAAAVVVVAAAAAAVPSVTAKHTHALIKFRLRSSTAHDSVVVVIRLSALRTHIHAVLTRYCHCNRTR